MNKNLRDLKALSVGGSVVGPVLGNTWAAPVHTQRQEKLDACRVTFFELVALVLTTSPEWQTYGKTCLLGARAMTPPNL